MIAVLNYNIVKEKELKKLLNFKRIDIDFASHQRYWENFEQENNSIAINVLFVSHNSEEIKLAYKSSFNKRKNQVILLMISDEDNNYFYFAIKNLSQLNSFGWLRGKKEAINNNDNFQNALDDVLNYQTIEKDPQRISKLKPYFNNYNWGGINFPVGSIAIALKIFYVETFTNKTCVAYESNYNNKRKKQVTLLMMGDSKNYHYLAVTNLSGLLQGNPSNHRADFYCLNCFNSYTTKNKLKEHEEICNKHNSCAMKMPEQAILKHNPG